MDVTSRTRARRTAGRLLQVALVAGAATACTGGPTAAPPATATPTAHAIVAAGPTSAGDGATTATGTAPAGAAPSTRAAAATSAQASSGRSGTPAAVRCEPQMLSASIRYPGGAVGHGGETVVLTNRSAGPCVTYAYPGLGLLDHGTPVALTVQRQSGPGFLYRYVPPTRIVLAPGAVASFGIEWINQEAVQATTLIITPPDDTAHLELPVPAEEVPADHTVTVTALAPGSQAGGNTGQQG